MRAIAIPCLLALSGALAPAAAQTAAGAPVAQGSPDVSVGDAPAARTGDAVAGQGAIVGGSPNVFINGKPAATSGSRTACGGNHRRGFSDRLRQRKAACAGRRPPRKLRAEIGCRPTAPIREKRMPAFGDYQIEIYLAVCAA